MKAYLLAAGFGTRLRPITDTIPKCLVEIAGYPMLDWWAKLLQEAGVTEILVNTHYLHEQVHSYIHTFNSREAGIRFVEVYEPRLLGSGGTVYANQRFVDGEEDFLICYADNLCDVKLQELISYHKQKAGCLTMALFRTNHPKQCGIAELDEYGKITEFEEKPQNPISNLANTGIYAANREIFQYLPNQEMIDFGKDVLPKLIGRMYGWETSDYPIDIGTMDNYERAGKEWHYDYYKDTLTN